MHTGGMKDGPVGQCGRKLRSVENKGVDAERDDGRTKLFREIKYTIFSGAYWNRETSILSFHLVTFNFNSTKLVTFHGWCPIC